MPNITIIMGPNPVTTLKPRSCCTMQCAIAAKPRSIKYALSLPCNGGSDGPQRLFPKQCYPSHQRLRSTQDTRR